MSQKTEIWYLIGALRVGGTAKTLIQLANNLDPDRYDVRLFTITNDVPMQSEIASHVKFETLDSRGKLDFVTALSFINRVRKEQPDILQSFLFFDNNLARIAGIFSSETTVISGVRSVPNNRPLARNMIDRATLPLSDHIVSNSKAGAKWISKKGVDSDLISVIYNGRNLEEYTTAEPSPELYNELDIEHGPVIGTVGRLIERKGHYDLLEAWPSVLEEYPDATLLFVGDGPEREDLEEFATTLGCVSSVRFLGMRKDVPELLDLMDIFVFPSHFEGLPGALLEAMAAGLPIVCTPVDGNSELIVDDESGLFVSTKSPDQITDRLLSLLNDTHKREQLSDGAQKRAKTKFTLQSMTSEFSQLYK